MTMLIILTALIAVVIILLIILITRNPNKKMMQIETQLSSFEKSQERTERALRDEIAKNREETTSNSKQLREEIVNSMTNIANLQKDQLDIFSKQLTALTSSNEDKLSKMRETIEAKLKLIQDDNTKKLDQMRETVDEKLHATLEKRLGESFKQVSERLEQVHKGLGEMQTLAVGVGDLKKVLSNVKTRGILGEIQLGNILEQILTPEQYSKNVATKKGSRENVEFAIKLPGKDDSGEVVYLPLDSKFPLENYHALINAYEHGEIAVIDRFVKLLEDDIKKCAKDIRDKYINPPQTTDFGILFLPIEGLYSEVVRRPTLLEILQRDFKIMIAGPTTLSAFLNSLQMGFRTLVIEKRSSEVWKILGAVKAEFGKFGAILEKTHKQLKTASDTIEDAARKSRTIETKLRKVQELPSQEAVELIGDVDETEKDGVIT
ncbi:MAG: DNA recombination protein RmuC [Nitrospirae bacterium]|nr:DNA recombination protein RmuC [Nitrospirota bacterium]